MQVPGYDVKVMDTMGALLPPGRDNVGEIVVKVAYLLGMSSSSYSLTKKPASLATGYFPNALGSEGEILVDIFP